MPKSPRYTVGMILYTRWRIAPVFHTGQAVTILAIHRDRGCAARYRCAALGTDSAGWVNEDDLTTAI